MLGRLDDHPGVVEEAQHQQVVHRDQGDDQYGGEEVLPNEQQGRADPEIRPD